MYYFKDWGIDLVWFRVLFGVLGTLVAPPGPFPILPYISNCPPQSSDLYSIQKAAQRCINEVLVISQPLSSHSILCVGQSSDCDFLRYMKYHFDRHPFGQLEYKSTI